MAYTEIGAWDLEKAREALSRADTLGCPVPGSVHEGLLRAGIIGDPMRAMHSEACSFVENMDFWLRTDFAVDTILGGDAYILRFDGIDLNADVYVNGTALMHCDNAFLRWEADAAGLLREGQNEVIVRVNEGLHSVRGKRIDFMRHSWNQEEPYRTWLRKPQYCYGWDWAKRLSTCGVYQGVSLIRRGTAFLGDVWAQSVLAEDHLSATLSIAPDVRVRAQGAYTVHAELYADERFEPMRLVASATAGHAETLCIPLDAPSLWWPNGCGYPYLYELRLTLRDADGQVLDAQTQRVGIRDIRFDERPLDAENRRFTVTANGRAVFAKGANWVPIDQLAGHASQEKYDALLESAVDMHMNMLRVWGGGLYETEWFFDACDRLGLMVWHDFMFACGYYPDFDADFMDSVAREAAYQVKRLRGRACFIGWSGNNEIHAMYDSHAKHLGGEAVFYGKTLYDELLPRICAEHDPSRAYRNSSPYGGAFPDSMLEGDQHSWAYNQIGNPRYMDLFAYAELPYKFLSEFGMLAPMNLETLRRCVDQDQQFPQSQQWKHHSNIGDYFDTLYQVFFGLENASESMAVDRYILMGQALQAECLRYVFEQCRARFPECSGALLWMYSDCYPTSGWTFVDYYLHKKALYYYTRRAFDTVGISFCGCQPNLLAFKNSQAGNAVDIKLCHDGALPLSGAYRRRLISLKDGHTLLEVSAPMTLPAQAVIPAEHFALDAALCAPEEAALLVSFEDANGQAYENRFFFVPFRRLRLARPTIRFTLEYTESGIAFRLVSDAYVWLCHLYEPEGARFSDNDFDLMPGIPKRIAIAGTISPEYRPAYLTMNECLLDSRKETV